MEVVFFEPIVVPCPKDRIYGRLGWARQKTNISSGQKAGVENSIALASDLIDLKGAALVLPVRSICGGEVRLGSAVVFKSVDLAGFLAGCSRVLLMGATAGVKITEAIKENAGRQGVTEAVIFDAAASEFTDSALTWITRYFDRQFMRQGGKLTARRFSAGYGDFSMDNQETIYRVLNMDKLGVRLTSSYMLVPEKSCTALAGIKSVRR